jgi:hypothetical protein
MKLNSDRFKDLKKMSLNENSKVVLSTEDGADIIHYTGEDYEGDTIRETGIANSLANLITSEHLRNNNAIEELRDDGYLDDGELFVANSASPYLFSGWEVAVETPMGVLNVK